MPDPCEPRLSPLRDDNDFVLLRCDANCFHLVLPFLSIHLTCDELRTATQALQGLWTKRARKAKAAAKTEVETPRSVLFQAFRCPGGHCHLVCHGTLNICLKEKPPASYSKRWNPRPLPNRSCVLPPLIWFRVATEASFTRGRPARAVSRKF